MMIQRLYVWTNKHTKLAWLLCLLPFIYWAFDREPPFEVTHYYVPPAVRAGDEISFVLDVKRNLSRDCSVKVSRSIKRSDGSIRPYMDVDTVSSAQLKVLQVDQPNMLKRTFPLPSTLPSGPTVFMTDLEYSCGINPLHAVWPIQVFLEWPFEVLPPEPASAIIIYSK